MKTKVRDSIALKRKILNGQFDTVPPIPQSMENHSPIVKTQTGTRPHPPTLQQQAALRQQQAAALAAGFQFPQGPSTPLGYIPQQPQTYPIINNNASQLQQQQQFVPQSPVSRKGTLSLF